MYDYLNMLRAYNAKTLIGHRCLSIKDFTSSFKRGVYSAECETGFYSVPFYDSITGKQYSLPILNTLRT